MKNLRKILILAVLIAISNIMLADKWKGEPRPPHKIDRAVAGCEPAKVSTEIAINNVRTLIHTGGDMWWDIFGTRKAAYEA